MNARTTLAAASLLLSACSIFDDEGRVTLSVADAPVDEAVAVVVRISGVSFTKDDGDRESVRLSPPVQVDLLGLTGGGSLELVSSRSMSAGRYRAVEFEIDGTPTTTESYIDIVGGGRFPLFVPDGAESGLRVDAGFDVDEGERIEVTVDFDLRRSIHPGDGTAYELRPRLRLVVDDETGIVSGEVAQSLLGQGCVPAVYAFTGGDVTPDDVDDAGIEPVSSAIVTSAGTGVFRYAIGFLEAGSYTLALTCEADQDDPGSNDDLSFTRVRNVAVQARRTTTLNLN